LKVQKQSRKMHWNPINEMATGGMIHERRLVEEEPKPFGGHAEDRRHRLFDAKIGYVENPF
jgi:hypothetical protein